MQLIRSLLAIALVPYAFATPVVLPDESTFTPLQLDKRGGPRCTDKGSHIVISSGHGAPDKGGVGLLSTTIAGIKAIVRKTNYWSVVYDKQNTVWAVGVASGVTALTNHLQWYTTGCPNTPIIMLGYSEGAIVTMNSLCGRSTNATGTPSTTPATVGQQYATNIAATILYGDETRVPGQSYNRGTCTTGRGTNPRVDTSGCGVFALNTVSYCDENDPQCCSGQGDAPDINVHYSYPGTYDGEVASFAQERVAAWRAVRGWFAAHGWEGKN